VGSYVPVCAAQFAATALGVEIHLSVPFVDAVQMAELHLMLHFEGGGEMLQS
jgi:hypothetical protein